MQQLQKIKKKIKRSDISVGKFEKFITLAIVSCAVFGCVHLSEVASPAKDGIIEQTAIMSEKNELFFFEGSEYSNPLIKRYYEALLQEDAASQLSIAISIYNGEGGFGILSKKVNSDGLFMNAVEILSVRSQNDISNEEIEMLAGAVAALHDIDLDPVVLKKMANSLKFQRILTELNSQLAGTTYQGGVRGYGNKQEQTRKRTGKEEVVFVLRRLRLMLKKQNSRDYTNKSAAVGVKGYAKRGDSAGSTVVTIRNSSSLDLYVSVDGRVAGLINGKTLKSFDVKSGVRYVKFYTSSGDFSGEFFAIKADTRHSVLVKPTVSQN